ncbi:ATP-binding protein [Symbioplanes lichenis]|uniref:ATP-binding protein n=1 Tax=Symbioplanes lichenis TaxID=1629072 RepID=UPI002738F195|nr:ATP-binding protein [Actinoplanes lichenis]
MEEQPPYLIDTGDDSITVSADTDGSVIDIAVRGPWTDTTGPAVATVVRQCLAERPAGVVVDVTGLDDGGAVSVPVWVKAAEAAGATEPPTRFVLCSSPGTALTTALDRAGLGVHAGAEQARTACGGRFTHVVRQRLECSPFSASLARNLVGGACHKWSLPALLHPGRAVMSELVSNAVEHARTDMAVSVSRRGDLLHLSVWDQDPTLPRIRALAPVRDGEPLDERGQGLRVVHADSVAWGAIPTAGGKLVWATVRDRNGRSRAW